MRKGGTKGSPTKSKSKQKRKAAAAAEPTTKTETRVNVEGEEKAEAKSAISAEANVGPAGSETSEVPTDTSLVRPQPQQPSVMSSSSLGSPRRARGPHTRAASDAASVEQMQRVIRAMLDDIRLLDAYDVDPQI